MSPGRSSTPLLPSKFRTNRKGAPTLSYRTPLPEVAMFPFPLSKVSGEPHSPGPSPSHKTWVEGPGIPGKIRELVGHGVGVGPASATRD